MCLHRDNRITYKCDNECANKLIPDRDDHHERDCQCCAVQVHRNENACKNIQAAWTTFVSSSSGPPPPNAPPESDRLSRRQRAATHASIDRARWHDTNHLNYSLVTPFARIPSLVPTCELAGRSARRFAASMVFPRCLAVSNGVPTVSLLIRVLVCVLCRVGGMATVMAAAASVHKAGNAWAVSDAGAAATAATQWPCHRRPGR